MLASANSIRAGFLNPVLRLNAHSVWGLCLMLLTACLAPRLSHAQALGGAVLLKNDRMIEGQVQPSGEYYSIQVAEGSRVSIPKSQVQHVGKDKFEIYLLKKDSTKRWEAGDHFQMTRWCMLNGLHAEAAHHYRQVAELHGEHPRVKQLALELQARLLELPGFRAYLGLGPIEEKRPDSPTVATVDNSAVVTASNSIASAAMHPQIAAHFSKRIQPILLNRCAQPACHGAQSQNGLRLMAPYRTAYERVSADNLRSVLGHVAEDAGELSALLRYATTAHGIQPQAGISITETQLLTEITNWIQFVQNPVASAVAERTSNGAANQGYAAGGTNPAAAFMPYSPAVTLMPVRPGESGLRPVPKEFGSANPSDFPQGDVPLASEIDALDRQLSQLLGETPVIQPTTAPIRPAAPSGTSAGSVDPFDPAEFNRQSRAQAESPR
ncbi:MAG: hypothetical protein NXI32_07740 [bacterium]|nr:hypothetical protein [bacterium]